MQAKIGMSAIYIGVMTGTSMDGLDLVAASFDPLKIHATLTLKFEEDLRDQLMALSLPDDNEIDRMAVAHVSLGKMIGNGVNPSHRLTWSDHSPSSRKWF
jgi:anhydro-N-acetylmuramic acid kinase